MTTLKIKRSNEFVNRFRKIGIYVDKKKIGTISNGETKEFEIPTGQHVVKAKIDWCGSNNLTCQINENELKTISISSFNHGKSFILCLIVAIALLFILKFGFDIKSDNMFLAGIFPTVLLFYYLTIGRSSYLRIKEE
jgi:hypothetical protein